MTYKSYKSVNEVSTSTGITCSCKYMPPVNHTKAVKQREHFKTDLCFQTIGNTKVRILE